MCLPRSLGSGWWRCCGPLLPRAACCSPSLPADGRTAGRWVAAGRQRQQGPRQVPAEPAAAATAAAPMVAATAAQTAAAKAAAETSWCSASTSGLDTTPLTCLSALPAAVRRPPPSSSSRSHCCAAGLWSRPQQALHGRQTQRRPSWTGATVHVSQPRCLYMSASLCWLGLAALRFCGSWLLACAPAHLSLFCQPSMRLVASPCAFIRVMRCPQPITSLSAGR